MENKYLILKTKLKVVGIKKNNTSKFFKHVRINDVIEISLTIRSSHGYAKYADVENLTTGLKDRKALGHLERIGEFYEFEEVV